MKPPKIGIWSIFRDDGLGGVARYRQRIEQFDYPRNLLRLYLCEGDSVDDTFRQLVEWVKEDRRVNVVKSNSGLPRHGHTDDPERLRILAQASNAAIDMLAADNWADYGCLVESDILLETDTISRLVSHIPDQQSVIAPMIWLDTPPKSYRFYDGWAFRFLDGERFPLVDVSWYLETTPPRLFEVQSAGSVVLFPIKAIKSGCRYNEQAIRGMCLQARDNGYRIYADPTINVFHPPEE